jgi:CRP-like cAMP-binding protein
LSGEIVAFAGIASRTLTEALVPTDRRRVVRREDPLRSTFERQVWPAGTVIFRAGDPGDFLYFVETGVVRLWVGADAVPRIIGRATAGAVFGEMAIIDRKPRMASASAETEVVVLRMPATTVRELVAESDPMVVQLIHGLMGYIRALAAQIDADAPKT